MLSDQSSATSTAIRLAKLEAILHAVADGIIAIESSGLIESINPATAKLFGYAADELVGRNIRILMPEPYAGSHDEYLANYLNIGTRKIIGIGREVAGRRKDGTTFPLHLTVSEFEVSQRRYFVGIITDLSEREAISEATEQALKESERRLIQAQKMEAVGQLAGGIAHDFNNLLTVITGNLELIEAHLPDERLRLQLKEIQDAANSGANLTHRLLAFSRQLPLTPQTVEINTLVLRTSELLRRTLGEHIALGTILSPDLWPVCADPAQVESALMNLAINARDAMPDGGRLLIETQKAVIDADQIASGLDMKPGDYVALAVSDTGSGIPRELRDRVFEPFFTTKGHDRGSGLGLAMIYGFVKQSGGHITLYSEIGHGSTFTIYLPRTGEAASIERAIEPRFAQRSPSEFLVLVVEDDPAVRRLNVARLRNLGYPVSEADSGAQALATIRDGLQPALIFTDAIMPGGVSGKELLEQARAIMPAVKILMTSGYSADLVGPAERASMHFKVLRKPHSLAELAAAVQEALS